MAEHPLRHLVGAAFPGGGFSLASYENWLAHDALYSVPRSEPHPIMAFIGAQQGMGMTVAGLFAWLNSDVEDGPLLANCDMQFARPLEVSRSYTVTGVIESIQRKQGRSLGTFDLVTCVFRLIEDSGDEAAVVRNTYAIGREGGAA